MGYELDGCIDGIGDCENCYRDPCPYEYPALELTAEKLEQMESEAWEELNRLESLLRKSFETGMDINDMI